MIVIVAMIELAVLCCHVCVLGSGRIRTLRPRRQREFCVAARMATNLLAISLCVTLVQLLALR